MNQELNSAGNSRPVVRLSWFKSAARCLICLPLAFCCAGLLAQPQTMREYQIKAGLLFKFTQFTEWPSNALESESSPLVIGVLGTDPFDGFLDETVRDELIRGRPVVVQRYQKVEEIKTCHILYIADSEAARLEHDQEVLKGRPVLTVSDAEGAIRSGMVVHLFIERNKPRLQINVEAARAAGLTISTKLLRVAEIVGPGKK
jgi:hypothetical protein